MLTVSSQPKNALAFALTPCPATRCRFCDQHSTRCLVALPFTTCPHASKPGGPGLVHARVVAWVRRGEPAGARTNTATDRAPRTAIAPARPKAPA
jgi:hypothetical protein